MLVAGLDTCYVDLFPFDWYIICFEDCLDCLSDLGTDTITYSSTVKLLIVHRGLFRIPGMRVTVYFPPNFVGLKMSDCMVAYAEWQVSRGFHRNFQYRTSW